MPPEYSNSELEAFAKYFNRFAKIFENDKQLNFSKYLRLREAAQIVSRDGRLDAAVAAGLLTRSEVNNSFRRANRFLTNTHYRLLDEQGIKVARGSKPEESDVAFLVNILKGQGPVFENPKERLEAITRLSNLQSEKGIGLPLGEYLDTKEQAHIFFNGKTLKKALERGEITKEQAAKAFRSLSSYLSIQEGFHNQEIARRDREFHSKVIPLKDQKAEEANTGESLSKPPIRETRWQKKARESNEAQEAWLKENPAFAVQEHAPQSRWVKAKKGVSDWWNRGNFRHMLSLRRRR